MARPGPWRRFLVRPLVWAIALVALVALAARLFLGTELARDRIRAIGAARLSEALGRPVTIGHLDFELVPFSVEVTDLVIPGDRPGARQFARVRRLIVEGDLEGMRRPVLRLDRVEIAGLELGLEFRQDGDNLPRIARGRSGGGSLTVEIAGLTVRDATVVVDEQKANVEVDARDVLARLAGLGGTDLEGTVAAQEVIVTLPDARPLPFALAAKAVVRKDRVEISNARVTTPELALRASGQVRWREHTAVDLTVIADGTGRLLDRLGYLDGAIRGPVHAEGTFGWRRGEWGWRAHLASPGVGLFGFELDRLEALAVGDGRRVDVDLERALFAGGAVDGTFAIELARPRYPARLDVEIAGADLDAVLARFHVPVAGLAGEVHGRLDYAFDVVDADRGRGEGSFEILAATTAGGRIPAAGSAQVTLADGAVELPAFDLAAPGQSITGTARLELGSGAGRVELWARSEDLGVLVGLPTFLEPGALWLPTAGTGELAARIDLDRDGYRAEIDLELADVAAPGLAAERIEGTVAADGDALDPVDLRLARGGARLAIAGRVPLDPAAASLQLELTTEGWPVEDARPWLPFELPLAGPAHGRLRLGGSLDAPTGEVAASVEPPTVAGIEARRLDLALTWDGERATLASARLASEAGDLEAAGHLVLATGALDLSLGSPAGLDLARPPFGDLSGGRLGGRLALDAHVAGTLERPSARAEGRITELVVAGTALDESPAEVSLRWEGGRVEARADLGGVGRLTGGGELSLGAASRLAFRFESERLDRLVALAVEQPPADLSGTVAADLELALEPGRPPVVTIVIPALEFSWGGRTLVGLEPVRARVDGEGLRIESLYLGLPGTEDELFVAGRVGAGDAPGLDLDVQTSIAASWLRPFAADLDLTGRLEGLAQVRGTLARPAISGQAEWSSGRLLPPVVPHSFDRIEALALFYPDAIVLDRLAAEFAGGRITAAGRVDLPAEGREVGYRFEAALRRATLHWPAGWQLRGDADLVLASTAEGRQVRGEVTLDRAWYLQDIALSPAQLIQRLLARSRVQVAETDELLSTTALAVAVRVPDGVRVRNNVARLSGSAELSVRGSLARPAVFGEVALESGGTVTYGGNTYTVERGELAFVNPERIDPLLDVVARTRVDQYDVTLNVNGSLERLNTTFASDPPLPDLDILGLLATGAPVERAAFSDVAPAAESASGSLAAEALLYGQAASLLTARVERLFGVDQLRVQPLTTGDTVSAARVSVGKRLSRAVYVTYSYDPSSTAQQILQVEWRMTDNLVLVLTQNGNDSYAVDARWESRF